MVKSQEEMNPPKLSGVCCLATFVGSETNQGAKSVDSANLKNKDLG